MPTQTFKKVLEYFGSCFDFDPKRERMLGIEKEVLAVDRSGHMADLSKTVWPAVTASKKYKMIYDDYYKDEVVGFLLGKSIVTTDAGLGTFEYILPPVQRVQDAEKLMNGIYKVISPYLKKFGFKMLGLGFQPITKPAPTNWNKKQRYEVLVGHYGKNVHYATLSASDQVHLDLTKRDVIPALNTFNKLNGFFVALFGNSPLQGGKLGDMEPREVMWDNLGKNRTGLPPHEFNSLEEYLSYLWKLPFIMAKNDEGTVYDPGKPFGKYIEGKSMKQIRELFAYHEGTTWFSSRPRVYGTLEVRPCGLQPFADHMVVSAFCTGIMKNLGEVTSFMKQFSWTDCRKFRYEAAKSGMASKINKKSVIPYLSELLTLSRDGLKKRGFGEAKYLDPLEDRIEKGKNPAQEAVEIWKKGKISALLKARGFVA